MALNVLAKLAEATRGKGVITKLDPSPRSKVITLVGKSGTGKTKQASRFPNPVFISLEKGLSATANVLNMKTSSWSDIISHVRTFKSRQWLEVLESGENITIVIDGAEKLANLAIRKVCSDAGVDAIDQIGHGKGYKKYEDLIANFINDLMALDYTLVFILHEAEEKDGFVGIKGDKKRNIDPIIENSDIVAYLTSNGTDEDGKLIYSSAHLVETDKFFARCRFEYADTYLEKFTADNLIELIKVGIERQIEAENADTWTTKEQKEAYVSAFTLTFDETISAIREQYMALNEMDKLDTFAEVVEKHLGDTPVSEAKPSQFESLQAIYEELADLIG